MKVGFIMKKILSGLLFLVLSMVLFGCSPTAPNTAPIIVGEDTVIFEIYAEVPDWTGYISVTDTEDGVIRIYASMVDDSDVNMAEVGFYEVDCQRAALWIG